MSDPSQGGVPYQQPTSAASDWLAQLFLVNQILRGKATAALVQVLGCTNAGGLVPAGTVDVYMLVNQVNGAGGSPTQHGPLYRLPYNRLQGGAFAAIIDPAKGDIGLAVFCSRDSSAAVAAHGAAPPGSDDVMGFTSGMYFGGFLNAVPTSYFQYVPGGGVTVVDPVSITLRAPQVTITAATGVTITAPLTTVQGALAVTDGANVDGGLVVTGGITGDTAALSGDVTADAVSLISHKHPAGTLVAGSTPVTGNTAAP